MKRILISLMTIAFVSSAAFGVTRAYFTDTEKNTGNTFSTGTIDIAVDGTNPWKETKPFEMKDMKPSQTDYIDFIVHNVGTNPVNLFKTLSNFVQVTVGTSEPKCDAIGGVWNGDSCTGGQIPNDLDTRINYDLRVELYLTDPSVDVAAKPYWWETIYLDSDEVKLDSLENNPMYLGMIPVNHYMKVIQSYHMPSSEVADLDNKYQGEKLTFDISLLAEQLTNKVVLENKYLTNTDVSHHVWTLGGASDGTDATLEYKVKEKTFDYTLKVEGMTDGPYTLVAWQDPTLAWNFNLSGTTTVLANVNVAGGVANITNSVELNESLINAKVWLVPGTLGAPGVEGVSLPWDQTHTLFETGLMDYYDADL